MSLISADDLDNYEKNIIATNAHKKHYKSKNEVRNSRSFKDKNFIERLISTSSSRSKSRNSSGQGIIPQHMIAREGNQLDYIYVYFYHLKQLEIQVMQMKLFESLKE